MAARIDCYIDLASLYSYLAFLHLLANRELLAAHSVELEFHPILLGGVNAGSGNKPPWTLPAKAEYGRHDFRRSVGRFASEDIRVPKGFMERTMTVLEKPNRALHFIKSTYPHETFIKAFYYLFHSFWSPPHLNISTPEDLRKALAAVPSDFHGAAGSYEQSSPLFSSGDVDRIMQGAASQEIKDVLRQQTQAALDRGAFGAPWLWVRNGDGVEEPFFGSDRFHFIWQFLGLPYQDVALLPPAGAGADADRPKL